MEVMRVLLDLWMDLVIWRRVCSEEMGLPAMYKDTGVDADCKVTMRGETLPQAWSRENGPYLKMKYLND
jgi:hypothetical protein